jgi:hypothetical protein
MMIESYSRGHLIVFKDDKWVYADNGMPIDQERPCAKCGREPIDGHDACIGHIDGATSACCGHGVSEPIIKYCIMPEMPYCPSCNFGGSDTSNCETYEDAQDARWYCTCTKEAYDKFMVAYKRNNPIYYSGCNYWNNGGSCQDGPIGTATAMHDCGDCPRIKYCLVKQAEPIFKMDKRQIDRDWKMVLEYERNKI